MPREKTKTREWEKCRRDRMKEAFINLEKVLPNYEPANAMSKIDVLQQSKAYIEELQVKMQKLMNSELKENRNVIDSETKKLKERIKKLISKNEILCKMLKDAKVGIPRFKNPRLWVGKISTEQAKIMQQKNNELTNETKKKNKPLLKRNTKRSKKSKGNVNKLDNKLLLVVSQTLQNTPYYLINNPIKPLGDSKKINTKPVTDLSSLGKGTLIFPNGNVIALGQNTSVNSSVSSIDLHNYAKVPPKYSTNSVTSSLTNIVYRPITILSKPSVCYTQTTQINKVPIPSLSSCYKRYLSNLEKPKPKQTLKKSEKTTKTKKKILNKSITGNKDKSNDSNKKQISDNPEKSNIIDKLTNKVENISKVSEPEKKINEDLNFTNSDNQNFSKISEGKDIEKNKNIEIIVNSDVTQNTLPEKDIVPEQNLLNNESIPMEEDSSKINKNLETALNYENNENLTHSELSSDLFSSLQPGSHNPESASPTAAFLLAFPLVSSLNGVKVIEGMEEETVESPRETPTLLQLGTEEHKYSVPPFGESITSNLMNMDTLSFFSGKENSFYGAFEQHLTIPTTIDNMFNKELKIVENKNETFATGNDNLSKKNYDMKQGGIVTESNVSHNLNQYIGKYNEGKAERIREPVVNKVKEYKGINGNNNPGKCTTINNLVPTEPIFHYTTKNYSEPLYTSCNNFNYNNSTLQTRNPNENLKNTTENYYKPLQKPDKTFNNSDNYSKDFLQNNTDISQKHKYPPQISKINQDIPTYNWMTTPTTKSNDNYLFPYSKDDYVYSTPSFITQTSYFNTTSDLLDVTKKSIDLQLTNSCIEKNENIEPNFAWTSSNKYPQFFESVQNITPQNFPSTTLPTLVGDLALGNNNVKNETKKNKYQSYENQHNFFSVSHLVDHTKNDHLINQNNRANRNKNNHKVKRAKLETKDQNYKNCNNVKNNFTYPVESIKKNLTKNTSSSYSAEALISNTNGKKEQYGISNNKNISVGPFMAENIVPPYFPDFQTNNEQPNQNYPCFPHNFRNSFQKNTYNNTYSTTNFIPPNNAIADNIISYNDNTDTYNPFAYTNKEVNNKNVKIRPSGKDEKINHDNNKKIKKKNPPGYVDFSFLSVPGSSHYLPDDFHSHNNFLPPTHSHIYPCKNPLYPKQNDLTGNSLLPLPPVPVKNNVQHETNLSSGNSGMGSSLTNFNLSTIFPEINKAQMLENYPDGKIKEQQLPPAYSNNSVNFTNNQPCNFPHSSAVQTSVFHNR